MSPAVTTARPSSLVTYRSGAAAIVSVSVSLLSVGSSSAPLATVVGDRDVVHQLVDTGGQWIVDDHRERHAAGGTRGQRSDVKFIDAAAGCRFGPTGRAAGGVERRTWRQRFGDHDSGGILRSVVAVVDRVRDRIAGGDDCQAVVLRDVEVRSGCDRVGVGVAVVGGIFVRRRWFRRRQSRRCSPDRRCRPPVDRRRSPRTSRCRWHPRPAIRR